MLGAVLSALALGQLDLVLTASQARLQVAGKAEPKPLSLTADGLPPVLPAAFSFLQVSCSHPLTGLG